MPRRGALRRRRRVLLRPLGRHAVGRLARLAVAALVGVAAFVAARLLLRMLLVLAGFGLEVLQGPELLLQQLAQLQRVGAGWGGVGGGVGCSESGRVLDGAVGGARWGLLGGLGPAGCRWTGGEGGGALVAMMLMMMCATPDTRCLLREPQ